MKRSERICNPIRAMWKSKLMAILLSIAMVWTMMPVMTQTVHAAAGVPTSVIVGNKEVVDADDGTSTTYWIKYGGTITASGASSTNYNVKYDGATGTLTLNGVAITPSYSYGYKAEGSTLTQKIGLYAKGDLSIILEGQNTITAMNAEMDSKSLGMFVDGALTIDGSGSLEVTGGADPSPYRTQRWSAGIYADNGITINGGNIIAIGQPAYWYSYGMYSSKGDITISGGIVDSKTTMKDPQYHGGGSSAFNKNPVLSGYQNPKATITPLSGNGVGVEGEPSEWNGTGSLASWDHVKIEPTVTHPTAWAELKDAIKEGGYMQLQQDITSSNPAEDSYLEVPAGKKVNLDLNGYSIDRKLSSAMSDGFVIKNSGDLTITDSSQAKNGMITGGFNKNDSTSICGGGIYNEGSLILNSGIISGNKADHVAGGIYNSPDGTFEMNGGSITGNAVSDEESAGGVYTGKSFKIKGNASISDNTAGSEAIPSNVYLPAEKSIAVSGALTGEGTIGVTSESKTAKIAEGQGYAITNTDLAKLIPDNSGYTSVLKNNEVYMAKLLTKSDLTVAPIADQIYTGSKLTPEPEVSYNGAPLLKDTDYELTYGTNKDIGNGKGSVSITLKGNYSGGPFDYPFNIVYGEATTDMYTVAEPNTNGWYNSNIRIAPKNGFSFTDGSYVELTGETSNSSRALYIKENASGKVYKCTFRYKLDKTAPDASSFKIKYNNNPFKAFLNTITFGNFFKETTSVTATATDSGSGIDTIQYYASNAAVDDPAGITGWQDSMSVAQKNKKVIYIKATDNAGNVTITNNEGIVVYADSTVTPDSTSFDLKEEAQADIKVTMTLNDNTFREIKNGSTELTEDTDYTISGNEVTLKKGYLKQFSKGSTQTLTFVFDPMGVENSTTTQEATVAIAIVSSEKMSVSLRSGVVTIKGNNTLVYGAALSALELDASEAVFEAEDGNEIEGTVSFVNPDAKPEVGTQTAEWKFVPDSSTKYRECTGTTAISVTQATPEITVLPTVSSITYAPWATLENITFTGNGTTSAEGNWSWKTKTTTPVVVNEGYTAVFTPNDTKNYCAVEQIIPVTVGKATPVADVKPTAAAITYGQTLADAALTGGTAKYSADNTRNIAGSYSWTTTTTKPAVKDSENTGYSVTFTPADTSNYDSFTAEIKVIVNKADNVPNAPGQAMAPAHSTATVGDVSLPEGWTWQEADRTKELADGTGVTATAVYTGSDKENYNYITLVITITRADCAHTETTEHAAVAATCTKTGNRAYWVCDDCQKIFSDETCTSVIELKDTVIPKQPHDFTGEYLHDTESHWHKCKFEGCAVTDTKEVHTWDDGVITTPATAAAEGVKTYHCAKCEETKMESVERTVPVIIEGANGTYTQGSKDGLTVRSDAAYEDFQNVSVDGEELDKEWYTTAEGSIIVTLKPEYLATLSIGKHTMEITSATGAASTEFTITALTEGGTTSGDGKAPVSGAAAAAKAGSSKTPLTGDASHPMTWMMFLLLSGAAVMTLRIRRKDRRK